MAKTSGAEGKTGIVVRLPRRKTTVQMTRTVVTGLLAMESRGNGNAAERASTRTFPARIKDVGKATLEQNIYIATS